YAIDVGEAAVALQAKLREGAGVADLDACAAAEPVRRTERDPGRPVAARPEVIDGAATAPAVEPVEPGEAIRGAIDADALDAVARQWAADAAREAAVLDADAGVPGAGAGVLGAGAAVVHAGRRGHCDRRSRPEGERREQ